MEKEGSNWKLIGKSLSLVTQKC